MLRRNFLGSLIGAAAGLWRAKWTAIPAFAAAETATAEGSPEFELNAKGIGVELSPAGEIAGVMAGGRKIGLTGRTSLAGCTQAGAAKEEKLANGAIQFTRTFKDSASGRSLTAVDRFSPAGDSVRWEIEIVSDGSPWTTDIVTEMQYPATAATRFWTAWADPVWSTGYDSACCHTDKQTGEWRDPLVLQPLIDATWNYGGYDTTPDHIVLPLATVAEPTNDSALSLVFSPADVILCGSQLTTTASGSVKFSRANYRLGGGKPVRFEMNLIAHEADWRGGLRWMTARYAEFFEPPSPKADAMGGCAAYSGDEGPIDVEKFKKMAFRVNWKLDDDMAYMGMFLPPVTSSDETWERSWAYEADNPLKPHLTSARKMNDYGRYLKDNGFYLLDYFNVFNFGDDQKREKADAPLWQRASAFLAANFPNARLRSNRAALDCDDPGYRKFLLEQVDRDIRWLPDSAGICIDNTYFMFDNNSDADDGVSWVKGGAARALCISWNRFFDQAGPKMRAAGKVIFASTIFSRFDVYRQIDGFYAEFGYDGRGLNSTALMGLRKPVMVWTYNESLFRTDPDSFFQRHLLMGAYPTAPYPWNNHCIVPDMKWENWGADLAQENQDGTRGFYYKYGSLFERDTAHVWMETEKYYLAYGPLMDAMRGKKWVLTPHCVEVTDGAAKANLFQVPGGYAMPVCFGGKADFAEVILRNLPGIDNLKYSVIHPGVETAVAATVLLKDKEGALILRVPLRNGCAMVTFQA
ncbi:MAG: hypothetical protein ABSC62_08800 [Terracidiphilus sp.]|jgi:hypothetical protein